MNTDNTILYVDDEKINLTVFERSLYKNYNVLLANSAAEAIDVIKNNKIKVLVSDQRMPDVTGLELIKKVTSANPEIVCMLFTAYTDTDTVMQAVNLGGVYNYITKPMDYQKMKIAIDNALEAFELKSENIKLLEGLKKSNNELEEHKSKLEEIVKARTKELNKKNNELEEINKIKDKFFSIISHDLKEPFNTLINSSGMLPRMLEKQDFDKILLISDGINKVAKEGYNLLENLLTWSRSQSKTLQPYFETVQISSVVNYCLGIMKSVAQNKNITIDYNIDNKDYVFADQNMFNTVLRNLVNNAIKFTKKGGKISINYKKTGSTTSFSVTDNGVGIKEEKINKLFSAESNYTTRGTNNEKGTGLGLILCKELVIAQGGAIWVESVENKGTTFYFTLKTQNN